MIDDDEVRSVLAWPLRTGHLNIAATTAPMHSGAQELIHDYLAATGHRGNVNGALFRPVKNRTGQPDEATPDGIYTLARAYSAALGFQIGAHSLRNEL